MAEQGQGDAERRSEAVADEHEPVSEQLLRDRQGRAGRLSYITFAVNSQLALTKLSAAVKAQMMDIEEHYGDFLTPEQEEKLLDARESMLDAADKLHGVAAELVGVLRKED